MKKRESPNTIIIKITNLSFYDKRRYVFLFLMSDVSVFGNELALPEGVFLRIKGFKFKASTT